MSRDFSIGYYFGLIFLALDLISFEISPFLLIPIFFLEVAILNFIKLEMEE